MIPTLRNSWRPDDAAQTKHNDDPRRNTDVETPSKKNASSRRISFKTKAVTTSSTGRRFSNLSKTSRLSVNKVQQLADKYNQLVSNENLLSEQPKMAKVVRRVNSCRKTTEETTKKQIKTDSNKSPVKRKPSVRQDNKQFVKAKISYLESPKKITTEDKSKKQINESRKPPEIKNDPMKFSFDSLSMRGSVKAAIEIFEKRSSSMEENRTFVPQLNETIRKPKVPDKNVAKTKELVYKNGVPQLKTLSKVTDEQKSDNRNESVIGDTNRRAVTLPRMSVTDTKLTELQIYFENKKIKTEQKNKNDDATKKSDNLKTTIKTEMIKTPQKSVQNEVFVSKSDQNFLKIEEKDTSNTYLSVENQKIIPKTEVDSSSNVDPKIDKSDENSKVDDFINKSIDDSKPGRSDESKITQSTEDSKTPDDPFNSSKTVKSENDKSVQKSSPAKPVLKTIYDSLKIARTTHPNKLIGTKTISIDCTENVKPNNSFLWRSKLNTTLNDKSKSYSQILVPPPQIDETQNEIKKIDERSNGVVETVTFQGCDNFEDLYDVVDPPGDTQDVASEHSYELFECTYEKIGTDYEYVEGLYETLPVRKDVPESVYYYESEENVQWTVDPNMAKRKLPPRPGSPYDDDTSNCYESIYGGDRSKIEKKNGSDNTSSCGSARDSIISCEQKSNSLYGRYGWGANNSDVSSDEWVDVSDPEESYPDTGFVIVRERQRVHKIGGWSDKVRNQWSKNVTNPKDGPSPLDLGHLYESLDDDDFDYDSFDSDTEDETPNKTNQNDSGVDVCNGRLPSPPSNVYSLVKQVMKLRPNWSIAKSLTRINKPSTSETPQTKPKPEISKPIPSYDIPKQDHIETKPPKPETSPEDEKRNSLGRKTWLKFRRTTSAIEIPTSSAPISPVTARAQSTFYVTDPIDIDDTPVEQPKPTVPIRRKSRNVTARPLSPPPPTPTDKKTTKKTSSWYTEVGLFKNDTPVISQPEKPSNTSWYAEIGLYLNHEQVSSSSSRENSGSGLQRSPVSSEVELRNERNSRLSNSKPDDPDEVQIRNSTYIETILGNNEDLYQFYSQAAIEKDCTGNDSDSEVGYEKINDVAMKMVVPKSPTPAHRYNRSLWCEIPEVKSSGILDVLTPNERKLQEAKFEIVASEVSYLKSLRVLEEHFEAGLGIDDLLSEDERNVLFGRLRPVVECSERLLTDLENCWSLSILLPGVCDIILRHSREYFQVYISYCENQVFVENTLKSVRIRRTLSDALRQLESSPTCQQLPLFSFLILPMQRITRLPLLIDAVLKRLGSDHEERSGCERALVSLNELTKKCNEAARAAERADEMIRVMSRLEFPPTVPPLPLEPTNSPGRYLVRSGELTQLVSRGEESQTITKLTMVRKLSRLPVHLFLFSDVLVIAKKRGDDRFGVMHHCPRNFIELSEESASLGSPPALKDRFLLFLTLLENHDMKTIEMVLSCANETDRRRWCEAFTPARTDGDDETLYEIWDCPQVATVHFYTTEQPDELNLIVGDIVNVTRKMADGWYYGERIRDGQIGWFPGNHTVEIVNRHVRARNLRQRYRLLTLTGSYISQARAAADQR